MAHAKPPLLSHTILLAYSLAGSAITRVSNRQSEKIETMPNALKTKDRDAV